MSTPTSSNHQMIGRSDLNDVEAILAITNTDVDAVAHAVTDNAEAIFTWDYERSRPALGKLYEKAKTSQWNGETDLPWDTDVDQQRLVEEMAGSNPMLARMRQNAAGQPGSPMA